MINSYAVDRKKKLCVNFGTHNKNLRLHVKALLLHPDEQFFLQSNHLIQNINHLLSAIKWSFNKLIHQIHELGIVFVSITFIFIFFFHALCLDSWEMDCFQGVIENCFQKQVSCFQKVLKTENRSAYLSASVWQTKNIGLTKIPMDWEQYNVEDCWNPAKELLNI